MIAAVRRAWDHWRGGGEAAVTVPSMDGALRPNQEIEDGERLLQAEALDNLVEMGGRVWFSDGNRVLELMPDGSTVEAARFEAVVTALAVSPDGIIAAGLESGCVVLAGDGKRFEMLDGERIVCPTALYFQSPDTLLVAQGSSEHPPSAWKRDLMERNESGSVWRLDLATGKAVALAHELAYPFGLAISNDGGIVVSEAWKHRLIVFPAHGGTAKPMLSDLPGYPARISATSDGGFWLAVFAPRGQLIEFVLREPEFRARMMADIDPAYWVAPSMQASHTFLEPLQGGAQKHLGMLKPWAPTRSYGLAVRLDQNFRALTSVHSRADGRRHGITSCVVRDGKLLVGSRGTNEIVSLDHAGERA